MRQNHMITAWPQNILPIHHWCTLPTWARTAMCRVSRHQRNCCLASRKWNTRTTIYKGCWTRLVTVLERCLRISSQSLGRFWHKKCPPALARRTRLSRQTTTPSRSTILPLLAVTRAQPWNNACWNNTPRNAPRRNAPLPWRHTRSSSHTVWMRVRCRRFLHGWAVLNLRYIVSCLELLKSKSALEKLAGDALECHPLLI